MYEIPCLDCNKKKYVGESASRIKKQIYKHIRDLKQENIQKGLVKLNLETNHNFNFKDSKMLVYVHNKIYTSSFQTPMLSET